MADETRDSTDALARRIALLESAVRALATELDQLKSSKSGPHAGPPVGPQSGPHPGSPSGPHVAPRSVPLLPANIDFESLIGRYGTLVLATVSALAAVGLFVGWAIDKGLLGPTQRIALGLLTAAGLAVGGFRLRRRERSFGASLLGLALAITQVCAWGAGPSLQLVPPWGAFLLASITSIALAVFARLEDDEPLWCVGFSGAAVAPFVTTSGKGNLVLLAAFGVLVLTASGYAMGARRWLIAGRLFLLAALVYTAALATGHEVDSGPVLAMAFPLAVALTAVMPWVSGWRRRDRLRALGALAALSALRSAMGINLPYDSARLATMIAVAGILWIVLVDLTHDVSEPDPSTATHRRSYEGDWLDAAVLPLGFVCAAAMALDAPARGTGIAMAGAAAVLMITVMRFAPGSLRDAAVFTTQISALVSVLLLLRGRELEITGAIAALSAACFAANLEWRSASWTTVALIGLSWTALASTVQLTARVSYQYTPFATKESVVAAVLLASIAAAWRFGGGLRDRKLDVVLRGAVVGWAFVWIHQEISFAFSETVATLLRVSYYAATSAAAVGVGRARHVPFLRHIGLGLAVLAAGTALYGARNLSAIGARIGADLVAAVFLLGIAYWYRRPGALKRVG